MADWPYSTEQVAQDKHCQQIPPDNRAQDHVFTVALHDVLRGRMTDAASTDRVARRYLGQGYETITLVERMHVHRSVGNMTSRSRHAVAKRFVIDAQVRRPRRA